MKLFYGSDLLIYLQGSVVIVLCGITLNKKAFKKINDAIEAIDHVKLLIGLVASCLLMIGFVISFHSEVFTSHDHYNIAKTKDGSKRNGYDWFNLGHVYRFPVEQLVPENSIIQINSFDIGINKKNRFRDYLYIIDKTGSTEETKSMQELAISLKDDLQKSLSRENATYREYINDLTDLADLLLIQSINELVHTNPNAKFRVGVYKGTSSNQPIDYLSNYKTASIENIGSFIELYKTQITKKPNLGVIRKYNSYDSKYYTYRSDNLTDYVELVQDVCDYGCYNTDSLSITLIGDLCHENENNLQVLRKNLYDLSGKNVRQVNLYRMPFNPNKLPSGWDSTKADAIATQVANKFKENFQQSLLYSEINSSSVMASEHPINFINSQVTQPNKPMGKESEISVYYPFSSDYNLDESMSKIEILKGGDPFYGQILISLRSSDSKEDLAEVDINNVKIKFNNIGDVKISNGRINLNFRSELSREKYYLDMYFPDDKTRITAPLIFRERLTTTSSLCLIFLYTTLYMSVTLLISIVGLLVWKIPLGYSDFFRYLFAIILILSPLLIFSASFFPALASIPDTDEPLALIIASLFPFIYLAFFFVHIYKNTLDYANNVLIRGQ